MLLPFLASLALPARSRCSRHARLLMCAEPPARDQRERWQLITSPSNARLKLVKKLHVRRQREKHGLVLLEGHRLVLDALDAGVEPDFVVLHDDAHTASLDAALRRLGPERVLRAPPELVASLSDTETPQGVLAVIPHAPRPLPPAPTLVLVCDAVSDPGNLGTLLRSAAGAGVGACLLTPGCCDPWGLKALRAGMGAQWRVPTRTLGWDDVASQLDSWGVAAFAADAGGEVAHFDVDWRTPSALVVGSEAHGLSGAVRADSRVNLCRIPLGVPVGAASDAQRVESAVESLNAAVAGSVSRCAAPTRDSCCCGPCCTLTCRGDFDSRVTKIILFEAQRQRLQRVAPE
jgi:TrmH family RNA methyltransferase